jgi:glyoxylase-like metal-dependent hydrolase (beta-lactamase superfamily II)
MWNPGGPQPRLAAAALCLVVAAGARGAAQIDLAGQWQALSRHEDEVHRIPGPELGDYAGFPLNEAGRVKAETWDASILSQPELQARPHPAQYSMRGPGPNFRMNVVADPQTNAVVAYTITNLFGNADRTIWMDGRPHPSPYAEHTWDGFSTGAWEGGALKVTTSHMKMGYVHRNGVAASPRSTMTEYFFRHGSHLVLVTILDDPVYLEAPLVRTSNFVWAAGQATPPPVPFEIVDELADRPEGWVPSYPLDTRHTEFARRFDLPHHATRGGAETTYPEYAVTMRRAAPRLTPAEQRAAAPRAVAPPLPVRGEVEVLHVQGRVYMLVAGRVNITAQVGDQGVVLVDTGDGAATDRVLARLRALSPMPIRYVVNTGAGRDHVGGNGPLSEAGVNLAAVNAPGNFGIPIVTAPIVAHERVLQRMSAPTGASAPFPFAAWPTSTFGGPKKTLHVNGEGIELLHQPAAHGDGDTIVFFRGSDVISTGDVFSTTSYPVIDAARGGTVQGVLDALNRVIDLAIPRFNQQGGTRIVPGHGRICNESDVVEYRNMLAIVRDRIQAMAAAGMPLGEVLAARPTIDYDGIYGADAGPWTTDMFVEAVYRDVRRTGLRAGRER